MAFILRGLRELLAPSTCAACELPLEGEERGWCGGCAALLEPASTLPPAPTAAALCYGGPLSEAIRRLKYERRTELVPALAEPLCRAAGVYAGQIDRVIPVPLHPRRLRERGFNQAALLARPLARALGVRLDTRSLRRVRDTPAQAGLSREQRMHNVAGAFVAQAARQRGPRVLLVDDVRTTGATLAAAAATLRVAGITQVRVCALAQSE